MSTLIDIGDSIYVGLIYFILLSIVLFVLFLGIAYSYYKITKDPNKDEFENLITLVGGFFLASMSSFGIASYYAIKASLLDYTQGVIDMKNSA